MTDLEQLTTLKENREAYSGGWTIVINPSATSDETSNFLNVDLNIEKEWGLRSEIFGVKAESHVIAVDGLNEVAIVNQDYTSLAAGFALETSRLMPQFKSRIRVVEFKRQEKRFAMEKDAIIAKLEKELASYKSELPTNLKSLKLPEETKKDKYSDYFARFIFEPLKEALVGFCYILVDSETKDKSISALNLTNRFVSSLISDIRHLIIRKGLFCFPDLFTVHRKGSKLEIVVDDILKPDLKKLDGK